MNFYKFQLSSSKFSPPSLSEGPKVKMDPKLSSSSSDPLKKSTVRSEEFDRVLLHSMGKEWDELVAYRKSLKNAATIQTSKKDVVDLSALLISCAEAVAADDCTSATELLKQIRQHSSPCGDGSQRLAHHFADARAGGPPKLHITGIEFPQPGSSPAERIEETGRRLANYAETFNVPFEYHAISKKWETSRLEDLMLDKNDFLVVNCLCRSKNLHDEAELEESSRTIVLNLIRNINPDIFIHGIVNGTYTAPTFVTRFREVLLHFSALFDMLETVVPREIPERMVIERDIWEGSPECHSL
ncbi:hypothetical protein K7X08_007143 [Anisodus acutangulus]|uniref:Scarecrow-like protein 9 n=1 Tax=Anisodus acutangulus TaxID=402998 RepID=A0A9Q1LEU3_9SOLA|nr:hypothetical protein K7X08_007143 [Anisodus acutangulus]